MTIPDYQTCMLPLLKYIEDGKEYLMRKAIDSLANHFQLTPAERPKLLPSGQQTIFHNRVGRTKSYLNVSST
ncbi:MULTISPECIES: winged helix-turn-helix domain-containing protein [Nitrosomonas]|uniref:Restriction system protein n=1 Tax=Nitrosomonas communis TaxID=44574 RepID=A0A0F7KBD0_9PROT|nr:hypothetical protein AAW31_07825 [Nitrosomonas communis]TYP73689.1 restriction system protein [Nitrosomonas communis]